MCFSCILSFKTDFYLDSASELYKDERKVGRHISRCAADDNHKNVFSYVFRANEVIWDNVSGKIQGNGIIVH